MLAQPCDYCFLHTMACASCRPADKAVELGDFFLCLKRVLQDVCVIFCVSVAGATDSS